MRYLLDTNTFVFMALDPESLSNDVLMALNEPSDHVIISHAMTEDMVLVSSDTRFPFYRRQGLKLLYNER